MGKNKFMLTADQIFVKAKKLSSTSPEPVNPHEDKSQILNSSTLQYIDIKDVKDVKGFRDIHEDIEQWNGYDVVMYVKNKYYDMTKQNLDINIKGCSKEVPILKDIILEELGDVNNNVIKLYIDFFYKYYLMDMLSKGKQFFFIQLKNKRPIKKFINLYKKHNLNVIYGNTKQNNSDKATVEKPIIDKDNIRLAYLLDELKLFLDYGIFISINWLMTEEHNTIEQSLDILYNCLKNHKDVIDTIVSTTNLLSPYDKCLQFQDQYKIKNFFHTHFGYTATFNIMFS